MNETIPLAHIVEVTLSHDGSLVIRANGDQEFKISDLEEPDALIDVSSGRHLRETKLFRAVLTAVYMQQLASRCGAPAPLRSWSDSLRWSLQCHKLKDGPETQLPDLIAAILVLITAAEDEGSQGSKVTLLQSALHDLSIDGMDGCRTTEQALECLAASQLDLVGPVISRTMVTALQVPLATSAKIMHTIHPLLLALPSLCTRGRSLRRQVLPVIAHLANLTIRDEALAVILSLKVWPALLKSDEIVSVTLDEICRQMQRIDIEDRDKQRLAAILRFSTSLSSSRARILQRLLAVSLIALVGVLYTADIR